MSLFNSIDAISCSQHARASKERLAVAYLYHLWKVTADIPPAIWGPKHREGGVPTARDVVR
jgi:hypothetical protein